MLVSSNILKENSRDLLREEESGDDDEVEFPINDKDAEFSITSIRIVLVDSDLKSLYLMKNLLTQFSYQVRDFNNGDEAIVFLKTSKHEIDLVIWDFHVPEINGLEALKTVGKEMDLPVVIMSHEHRKEAVMESTKRGSCNFLVKPVSKEIISVLWQHVYRKRISVHSVESDVEENIHLHHQDNTDGYQTNNKEDSNSVEQNSSYRKEDKSKKPRMTWTPELHQLFEKAVEKCGGVGHAVPKLILKCMQEEMDVRLTRNNVASHLQKYRLGPGKKSSVHQETREDSQWRNAAPNTALTATKLLPNSSFGLQTRVPYFANDQNARNGPMQYPSTNYFTMNNNHFITNSLASLPYTDSFHQQQQQQQQFQHQQYPHPSLQLPSMITKQESPFVSAAMENPDLIANQNTPQIDWADYLLEGLNYFDKTNRY